MANTESGRESNLWGQANIMSNTSEQNTFFKTDQLFPNVLKKKKN